LGSTGEIKLDAITAIGRVDSISPYKALSSPYCLQIMLPSPRGIAAYPTKVVFDSQSIKGMNRESRLDVS